MARPGRHARLTWNRTKANHGRKPSRGKIKSQFLRQRLRSRKSGN